MHAAASRIYILQRISGSAEKRGKLSQKFWTVNDFYGAFDRADIKFVKKKRLIDSNGVVSTEPLVLRRTFENNVNRINRCRLSIPDNYEHIPNSNSVNYEIIYRIFMYISSRRIPNEFYLLLSMKVKKNIWSYGILLQCPYLCLACILWSVSWRLVPRSVGLGGRFCYIDFIVYTANIIQAKRQIVNG